MTNWMIGQASLAALIQTDARLAAKYFNTPTSFTFGPAPQDWRTTQVNNFQSYAGYAATAVRLSGWVLYDPESWPATPLLEQQHPAAYMSAFVTLAKTRGQKVILAPARNLVTVAGGDCAMQLGESVDAAYLRTGLPSAGAVGDVFECQAQALQSDTSEYQSLVAGAGTQLPSGHLMWAGLTTLRGDSVQAMVDCYHAVPAAAGFWLNTSPETISVAAAFLSAIS
jgi:hypothetical protein